MAPSKLKKAIGAVKDRTSIGLAKVGASPSISDLEVAIVKATRHDEYPPEDKYIHEILSLTYYSRAYVNSCVSMLSRRLGKTKNWMVALKTLMLIHRLLNEGDKSYAPEIFFSTRRGTRLLNMSDFRDTSRSNSWDYSAFVRTYALYLDEQLDIRMMGKRKKTGMLSYTDTDEEEEREGQACSVPGKATPVREMSVDQIFTKIQHLMQLLERFLACRPTGMAKQNRVVIMALYAMMKESFFVYQEITEIQSILIDLFMELEVSDCVKIYEIFCRLSKQIEDLEGFYEWSKPVGIARLSEYPEIEKITLKQLEVMDKFIRDKSNAVQEPVLEIENKEDNPEVEEEDMNAIKALPPPEESPEEEEKTEEVEIEEKKEEVKEEKEEKEADLLNLADDAVSCSFHGDQLALALFDGGPVKDEGPVWEAFKDGENWETALVESATRLSNHPVNLSGGFDMMLLNGMYQQGELKQAMSVSGYAGGTGSASSVAVGSAGRPPAMLALPAPEGSGATTNGDPFAASVMVPPPSYVQMSEMEKKQRWLVEEQMMWQQYSRGARQGHVALGKTNHTSSYSVEGYTRTY